jgi:hypothetical protein
MIILRNFYLPSNGIVGINGETGAENSKSTITQNDIGQSKN